MRAAQPLPRIRHALQAWRDHATPLAPTREAADMSRESILEWLRNDPAWGVIIAPKRWRTEDDDLLELIQRAVAWARAQATRPATQKSEIDEESAPLISWLLEMANAAADADVSDTAGRLTLAAQLLGERRPAIQPVPVSERLPGGKDLDKNGRYWVYQNERTTTHWLPHWAIPLPAADQQEGQDDA